jgi:hypothetical protein
MYRRDRQGRLRRARPRQRDVGTTFIELLVAVVILGTAGIAVLAATAAAITGAKTSDDLSKAQQQLAEAADFLSDTEPEHVAYEPCSGSPATSYQAALDTEFGPGAVEVVSVSSWADQNMVLVGCDVRYRLQRVELRATVADAGRLVAVVKRPATDPTVDVEAPETPPDYVPGSGNAEVGLTPWL